MKRLGSSDSLGALISIYPSTEEKISENNHVYSGGFQSMLDSLDEEDCGEESGQIGEKKRRLNVDQVKALEKNFEVENKLEPDRKVKLAQELGLQPRQVAVWFQNRRARWKTKQLEKDYGLLKANYEDLKLKFDAIKHDKESLLTELRELKSKLQEDNNGGEISVKEEILISESEEKAKMQNKISATEINDPNQECYNDINGGRNLGFFDFKDGSSDSDSSAILNDDTSPNAGICSSEILQEHHLLISPPSSSLRFNYCSSNNFLPLSDSRAISNNTQKGYQPQFVKMEEYDFFNAEEPCNFFSEDQGPTLQWYSPDQWT